MHFFLFGRVRLCVRVRFGFIFFVGRVSEEGLCGVQEFVAYRSTVAFFLSLFSYSPDRRTDGVRTHTRETGFGNNARTSVFLF